VSTLAPMLTTDAEPFERRLDSPLSAHWFARLERHFNDSYMGIRLQKFPEDLRVYEHLLTEMRADTVIELGTANGASALWFRDRLATLERYGLIAAPQVVSVDLTPEHALAAIAAADPDYEAQITVLRGDVLDPELPGRVRSLIRPDARCFVVEDSAHVYDTSLAALRGFADLVPVGGWFVVEDGCVDVEALRLDETWPRGVQPAITD
jgi:cephalosporin hydroxylase